MNKLRTIINRFVALALVLVLLPLDCEAKGFGSGGGRGYSSSRSSGSFSGRSSYSSSRGSGGKSYSSGGGKSYGSGSSSGGGGGRSYSASKNFASGPGHLFTSHPSGNGTATPPRQSGGSSSRFTFDTAAARARKEESSRWSYSRFKDSLRGSGPATTASYRGPVPPVIRNSGGGYYRQPAYVPDVNIIVTRPYRVRTYFAPYYSRPVVIYQDHYSSFFWWWLLDRSLDDRAYWAYHHRYDMDDARYQALLATDAQLQARVAQLEAQPTARDPNYVPAGLDRDLMYSDNYVNQTYNRARPTVGGRIAFWVLGVPSAIAVSGLFVWLLWFKRW